MTDHIYEANDQFDFNQVVAKKPISQSGGNFLIKFTKKDIPLYIQTPKCNIKQRGDLKPGKKSTYCDLVFLQEHDQFIQWMENLEQYSQQVIFKNKTQWFETELELEDIENSFTSPMKSFKSGKSYLVRTNIPYVLGKSTLKIYDEDENPIELESLSENIQLITILEVQGIRCSARSFQIELELKQMMVLKPVNLFEKCILKPKSGSVIKDSTVDSSLGKIITKIDSVDFIPENKPIREPILEDEKEDSREPLLEENIKLIEEPVLEDNSEEPLVEDNDDPIKIEDTTLLKEVEFDLEKLGEEDTVTLKQRKDVYYEMYKEARRKAKVARDLALSSYLEAKRIKNTYMLDDIIESDESDEEIEDESDKESDEESEKIES